MGLPFEIVEEILTYLKFSQVFKISDRIAKKLYNPDKPGITWAAANGHLDIVKWLHKNTIDYHYYISGAMYHAAHCGHLDVVKYLHENIVNSCPTWAIIGAAENGHFEIVKLFYKCDISKPDKYCIEVAIRTASRNNNIKAVRILQSLISV